MSSRSSTGSFTAAARADRHLPHGQHLVRGTRDDPSVGPAALLAVPREQGGRAVHLASGLRQRLALFEGHHAADVGGPLVDETGGAQQDGRPGLRACVAPSPERGASRLDGAGRPELHDLADRRREARNLRLVAVSAAVNGLEAEVGKEARALLEVGYAVHDPFHAHDRHGRADSPLSALGTTRAHRLGKCLAGWKHRCANPSGGEAFCCRRCLSGRIAVRALCDVTWPFDRVRYQIYCVLYELR